MSRLRLATSFFPVTVFHSLIVLALVFLWMLPALVQANDISPVVQHVETVICKTQRPITVSPDGKSMAWVEWVKGGMRVYLNGKHGIRWDTIDQFCFSPDSKHLAYMAYDGNDKYLVLDQVTQGQYIDHWCLGFTPDSSAVILRSGNVDNALPTGKRPHNITKYQQLSFTRDGKHRINVCTTQPADEHARRDHLMLDGKELYSAREISEVTFSADGAHWACVAEMQPGKCSFVLDGKPEEESEFWPESIVFSPDGKRVGYLSMFCPYDESDRCCKVIVDSKQIDASGSDFSNLTFSPDSKHFAYINIGFPEYGTNEYTIKLDGKAVTTFSLGYNLKESGNIVFSPNSSKMAVFGPKDDLGKVNVLMINGNVVSDAKVISSMCFSPDSAHYACVVQDDIGPATWIDDKRMHPPYKSYTIMVDGIHLYPHYQNIIGDSLRFMTPHKIRYVAQSVFDETWVSVEDTLAD